MCSGSKGSGTRRCVSTKAASSTTPAVSETTVAGACQASVSALEKPKTMANRPAQASATPRKSMRGRAGWRSLTSSRRAINAAGIAMSRLT